MTELRRKHGTACAEVIVDNNIVGEVEYMNYPPIDQGDGDAWRWRDASGAWGNAETQDVAVAVVVERWRATARTP